jgi:DNA-binding transcriptional ArsR family regulator
MYDKQMNTEQNLSDFESMAITCKALSHPARLEILQTLASRGTCICGEIVDVMPLSQATVSQHLKVLKNADLITGEIDGQRSCYCINTRTIRELREKFGGLFGSLENCC